MSKYDGVVNELFYMLADNDKFYSTEEKIKICNVVKEAIAKAKKYDGEFADMYAREEMEIGRLTGKILDLERENKILKEALKSLKKAFEFRNPKDFTNDDYYVLYQTAEIDSLCDDYSIIKKALEVIENE